MISINELIKGCWIEYRGEYKQISSTKSFSRNENFVKFSGLQSNAMVSCVDINPIKIDIPHFEFVSKLELSESIDLIFAMCNEFILINNIEFEVKYLHQLQRIYFLQTNKELDIQP